MRSGTRSMLFVVGLVLLPPSATAGEPARGEPVARAEPTTGTWSTWVIGDPAALLPPEPPAPDSLAERSEIAEVKDLLRTRTPAIETSITAWGRGAVLAWSALHRELVQEHPMPPPRVARDYALVSIAMYDAAVAAWRAKDRYRRVAPAQRIPGLPTFGLPPTAPSYVAERSAISAAAATVLRALYPAKQYPRVVARIDERLQSAIESDRYTGAHYRSDVEAGANLGGLVGERVARWAANDGAASAQQPYTVARVPGRWEPTVPASPGVSADPVLPGWGRVKTWVLARGDALRSPPPPRFNGPEWNRQIEMVHQESLLLDAERRRIVDKWAGGPGTPTPAGLWQRLACDLGEARRLSEPRMARVLALLGVAQADAFVACWDCKYAYDVCRPVTAIRERIDPQWSPYLATPPFPSYPSGHSTTSYAASQVLAFLFPESAVELAVQAAEAKDSRLYGGIHTRLDNDAGAELGRLIGSLVIARAARDGSP